MPHPLRLALAFALATVPLASRAQEGEPTRVRGIVESVDDGTLTVTTRDGETAEIALADGWQLVGVTEASMDDIGPGSYVGVASLPMEDGRETALEVLIFPEAMAGAGEGQFPWDLQPESTMTNATVAAVDSAGGGVLTLTYGDAQTEIVVPEDVPVVTFGPAAEGDLVPGATVFVPGQMLADGSLSTGTVVVETGGTLPPM